MLSERQALRNLIRAVNTPDPDPLVVFAAIEQAKAALARGESGAMSAAGRYKIQPVSDSRPHVPANWRFGYWVCDTWGAGTHTPTFHETAADALAECERLNGEPHA